jgi:beta-lactamase class D
MNKLVLYALTVLLINTNAIASTNDDYAHLFKDYHGCYILYDITTNKIVRQYNPDNRCDEQIAPDSTFKIALSLMAFDSNIINQHSSFKWDGHKGIIPEHDKNQSPKTWLLYSVLWVSQQITPKLGCFKIKQYLADFNYGNQDFSGDEGKNNGLTHAWLSSSLNISAVEQLHFLKAMLTNQLKLDKSAIKNTRDNLYLGTLVNGAKIYGKTGSGRHGANERQVKPSLLRDGWFVGFVEQDKKTYIFVSNLTDKKVTATLDESDGSLKPFGSQLLKPITMELLEHYFSG